MLLYLDILYTSIRERLRLILGHLWTSLGFACRSASCFASKACGWSFNLSNALKRWSSMRNSPRKQEKVWRILILPGNIDIDYWYWYDISIENVENPNQFISMSSLIPIHLRFELLPALFFGSQAAFFLRPARPYLGWVVSKGTSTGYHAFYLISCFPGK